MIGEKWMEAKHGTGTRASALLLLSLSLLSLPPSFSFPETSHFKVRAVTADGSRSDHFSPSQSMGAGTPKATDPSGAAVGLPAAHSSWHCHWLGAWASRLLDSPRSLCSHPTVGVSLLPSPACASGCESRQEHRISLFEAHIPHSPPDLPT